MPASLVLDPHRSSIRIRTFAEGLFSRLAHDLELVCRDVSGTAPVEGEGHATLEVPIAKIDVAGTLKHGRVDPGGLSSSDREDCLGKMRREVFHGGEKVTIEASLTRVRITPPKGPVVERTVSLNATDVEGGAKRVAGSIEISLAAIGAGPVKGPMNAFRVKDVVEVIFDVVFQPA